MEDYSDKLIVYPQDNGIAAIVIPAPNSNLSLEEIIARSVPTGTPYRVINRSDLPTDHTFRDAWEYVDDQG